MKEYKKGDKVEVDGRVGEIGYDLPYGDSGTLIFKVPTYKVNFPDWTGCYASVHDGKLVKVPGSDGKNMKPDDPRLSVKHADKQLKENQI